MRDFLSALQAAKVIGCNPQKVRMKMKLGQWDIGMYTPKSKKPGAKNDEYLISKVKLAKFLGINLAELDERLA